VSTKQRVILQANTLKYKPTKKKLKIKKYKKENNKEENKRK
jgi:hypothetical protein